MKMDIKAITLTELLIVIVIVGILAAVIYPNFQGFILKAKLKEVENVVQLIATAERTYYFKNGSYYTWNNWESGYSNAESNLNITIPKGSEPVCEYRVMIDGPGPRVEFRYALTNLMLGRYSIPADTYTIHSTPYEVYLKYLVN